MSRRGPLTEIEELEVRQALEQLRDAVANLHAVYARLGIDAAGSWRSLGFERIDPVPVEEPGRLVAIGRHLRVIDGGAEDAGS